MNIFDAVWDASSAMGSPDPHDPHEPFAISIANTTAALASAAAHKIRAFRMFAGVSSRASIRWTNPAFVLDRFLISIFTLLVHYAYIKLQEYISHLPSSSFDRLFGSQLWGPHMSFWVSFLFKLRKETCDYL